MSTPSTHLPSYQSLIAQPTLTPALIYVRVSSDEQADNYSPDRQLKLCRDYCQGHGLVVDEEHELFEDFTGRVPIEQRPEGGKAFRLLESGVCKALVAWRFDRIVRPPREGDEWDTPPLIRGLAALGCEIHTVHRGRIGTDFASLLVALLDARSSGEELRAITQRTWQGRVDKAAAGLWVGNGGAPYGLRKIGEGETARLQIDPDAARAYRRIFAQYTGWEGEARLSQRKIAEGLERDGVPPPPTTEMQAAAARRSRPARPEGWPERTTRRKRRPPKPEGERRWHQATISRLLQSRTVLGEFHFNEHVVHIPELQIVEQELWDAAQAQRAVALSWSKRKRQYPYILAGLLFCACGRRMMGMYSDRKERSARYYYYICNSYHERKLVEGEFVPRCQERRVRIQDAEDIAWEWVQVLRTVPGALAAALAQTHALARDPAQERARRLSGLEQGIETLTAQIAGSVRAIGRLSGAAAKAAEGALEADGARLNALVAERDALASVARKPSRQTRVQALERTASALGPAAPDASPEARRDTLERLGVRARVEWRELDGALVRGLRLEMGADASANGASDPETALIVMWKALPPMRAAPRAAPKK